MKQAKQIEELEEQLATATARHKDAADRAKRYRLIGEAQADYIGDLESILLTGARKEREGTTVYVGGGGGGGGAGITDLRSRLPR